MKKLVTTLVTLVCVASAGSVAHGEPTWRERWEKAKFRSLEYPDDEFSTKENHLTVKAATRAFGVQTSRMVCIIEHESGWNEYAKNPTSTASGLVQFVRSTWDSASGSYRSVDDLSIKPNASVFNARANILVAAKLMQGGQWFHWEGSGC